MTPTSPEAAALDPGSLSEDVRRLILDFMQMEEFARDPLVVTRADGVRFWDAHGREYLDGLAGIYVVNVGYNNRRVIAAMKAQLDTLTFAPPLHATAPPAIALGRLLAAIAPGDLPRSSSSRAGPRRPRLRSSSRGSTTARPGSPSGTRSSPSTAPTTGRPRARSPRRDRRRARPSSSPWPRGSSTSTRPTATGARSRRPTPPAGSSAPGSSRTPSWPRGRRRSPP
jgi:hypothetical protein